MNNPGLNLNTNQKGMLFILVACVAVGVAVVSLGIVRYLQSTLATHQIQKDKIQALLQAQEGVAYALKEAELAPNQWSWKTHQNDLITSSDPNIHNNAAAELHIRRLSLTPKVDVNNTEFHIVNQSEAYYTATDAVTGAERFRVKVYPEAAFSAGSWKPTSINIILSQATVGKVTRSLQYRFKKYSLFEYFSFFPGDYEFSSGTYNGLSAGGIMVNGNITLSGSPSFRFLSELTAGGYIKRAFKRQFADSNAYGAGNPQVDVITKPYAAPRLPLDIALGNPYHWDSGNTDFISGDPSDSATWTTETLGPALPEAWDYDKYLGDPGLTTPDSVEFTFDNTDLKNLAIYEEFAAASPGDERLFEAGNTLNFGYYAVSDPPTSEPPYQVTGLDEIAAFRKAMQIDSDPNYYVAWNAFWLDWKTNHNADYAAYAGLSEPLGDWQRRFWCAAYDVLNPADLGPSNHGFTDADGVKYGVNDEWWQDLLWTNADNRPASVDDMYPAQDINENTGLPEQDAQGASLYYLDSERQFSAWYDWVNNAGLQDIIKDASLGGEPIAPFRPIDTDFMKSAWEGGIYYGVYSTNGDVDKDGWLIDADDVARMQELLNDLGIDDVNGNSILTQDVYTQKNDPMLGPMLDVDGDGSVSWDDYLQVVANQGTSATYAVLDNIDAGLEGVISDQEFFNPLHTARYSYPGSETTNGDNKYSPSHFLKFDIDALKDKVANGTSFNGIIYVDVTCKGGVLPTPTVFFDPDAEGVILAQAEALPAGGLTLFTPNNVVIAGNFNLDPTGDSTKKRPADSQAVRDRVTNPTSPYYKSYIESLHWEPAAVIALRNVYTVSDDFTWPPTMPVSTDITAQYEAESYGYFDVLNMQVPVESEHYGSESAAWMPPADGDMDGNLDQPGALPRIERWFALMEAAGRQAEAPVPVNWSEIYANTYWGAWNTDKDWVFTAQPTTDPDYPNPDFIEIVQGQNLREELSNKIADTYKTYFRPLTEGGTEERLVNKVSQQYIYNLGIASPYSPQTYPLERWDAGMLTINGSFIQLPDEAGLKLPVPNESYAAQTLAYASANPTFNYESRYNDAQQRPKGDIVSVSPASWRLLEDNNYFNEIDKYISTSGGGTE